MLAGAKNTRTLLSFGSGQGAFATRLMHGRNMKVGYIGLGAMGSALATHLLQNHSLTVLDLNPSAVASFVARGAYGANDGSEVARRSDVVLLCLPRSSDVRAALFGPNGLADGLKRGSVVIDQTSGMPSETHEMARDLQKHGIKFLDAPVAGGMAAAHARAVSIIVSGDRAALDQFRPVLTDISPNLFYVGERVGNAQTMKAVNNMLNCAVRVATLECVAMGRKLGLPLETMIEALNASCAWNFTSRGMLPALAQGRQSTQFRLALQVKDANQAIDMGAKRDVAMPLSSLAAGVLQIGLNTLGKDAQLEQIIGVIESMAATQFVAGKA